MRGKIVFGLVLAGAAVYSFLNLSPKANSSQVAQNSAQAQTVKDRAETVRLIDSIQGPALYTAYCAVCHGSQGKGNGPLAAGLKVRPSDLTHIAAANAGKFPSDRIEKIISGEIPLPAGHGSREMPVWGPIFSQIAWDQDLGRVRIDNLTRYIKELQAK